MSKVAIPRDDAVNAAEKLKQKSKTLETSIGLLEDVYDFLRQKKTDVGIEVVIRRVADTMSDVNGVSDGIHR